MSQPTPRSAVVSVILAFLGYIPLAGPIAIVLGIHALRSIGKSDGKQGGEFAAQLGIAVGAFATLTYVVVLGSLIAPRLTGTPGAGVCMEQVTRVGEALVSYRKQHGHEARDLYTLSEAGLIQESGLQCPHTQQRYQLVRYDIAAESDIRLHDSEGNSHGQYRVALSFDGEAVMVAEADFDAEQAAIDFLSP